MPLNKKYTEIRKLIPGKNDLLTWCKENGELGETIIKEWDISRNGSMEKYKPGSCKQVWFICSICNTPYKKSVRDRVNGGMHRPCGIAKGIAKRKEYQRKHMTNSLMSLYPELIEEWDYEKNRLEGMEPEYYSSFSSKKAHWICKKCGNEYATHIRSRTVLGVGCKACKKEKNKK